MKRGLHRSCFAVFWLVLAIFLSSCANRLGKESVRLSFAKPEAVSTKSITLALPFNQQRIFIVKTRAQHYEVYSCQDDMAYNYYPFDRHLCKKVVINTVITEQSKKITAGIYLDPVNWLQRISSAAGFSYDQTIKNAMDHIYLQYPIDHQSLSLNYLPADFASHYVYSLIDDSKKRLNFAKKASNLSSVSFLQRNKLDDDQYVFINVVIQRDNDSGATKAGLSCEYVWKNKINQQKNAQKYCKKNIENVKNMLIHLMGLTPKQLKEAIYRLRLHLYNVY